MGKDDFYLEKGEIFEDVGRLGIFEGEDFEKEILDRLKDVLIIHENSNYVAVPENVSKVLLVRKIMKLITKGSRASVSMGLYQPFRSMGYVTVKGLDVLIKDTNAFLVALNLCDNFESYCELNGTVVMDFTFQGLTKTIDL